VQHDKGRYAAYIRSLATALETDSSNLAKVLSGSRNAGDWLIHAQGYFMKKFPTMGSI